MPTIIGPVGSGKVLTNYRSGLGGPVPNTADIGGHLKRSIVGWVDALEPTETPILSRIKKGKSVNQQVVEWGTSSLPPLYATLKTNINTTDTSVVLNSGEAKRFRAGQTFAIYARDGNNQPAWGTREVIRVTDVNTSTDTLTVVRAQGGTSGTAFTGGTTSTGAYIQILPTAISQHDDFKWGPTAFGTFYSNTGQLFMNGVRISEEANATPNVEFDSGNHIARLMKDATQRCKLEFESALIHGAGQQGQGTEGSEVPSMMTGILGFVPSGNKTDLLSARVTPYDIEVAGAALWDSVGDNGAKTLLMSMRTARMFDGLLNKYRVANMSDTSITPMFRSFETRFGQFSVTPTRWIPEGVIVGVNFDKMSIHPYEGMDWTEREHATNGPYLWRSVYAKYTLVVQAPETFWMLYGFDTDLSNYGRVI